MTRINVGINPHRLTDEHLRAEHREIQRLPSNYVNAVRSGSINKIPQKFKLGTGHVLFFLDKFDFVNQRVGELKKEIDNRNFKGNEIMDLVFNNLYNNIDNQKIFIPIPNRKNYNPTTEDKQLLIDRIIERINNSSKKYWHYYGERISKERAISILNQK